METPDNNNIEVKDDTIDNPEDNELLKYFLENVPPRGLYRVSNVFKQAPDKEFVKLRRLIAMDDLKLLIDEVNVEMLK